MPGHVAVDLGAESGRVIHGDLADGKLTLSEVRRFSTGMRRAEGHLRWEMDRILESVEEGLRAARRKGPLDTIGVDAWGVDFGLVDARGRLLEQPVAYRDERTDGVMERFFARISAADIFERTGVQSLPFNTLYQLAALTESEPDLLRRAHRLLLIPDLAHHHLTGRAVTEFTNATTTQCFDPRTRAWHQALIEAAGADPDLFAEIVEPATSLGTLSPEVRATTGLGATEVIAPASHDTASAVAAVPARGEDWAYLSSGTWSLLGIETPEPIITEPARGAGFTNEGGLAGTNRFLKNIMGLWIVQRLRADIGEGAAYEVLAEEARAAPPFRSLVDVNDPRFLHPASMPEAIATCCRQTGQPVPEARGEYVRCALDSLALEYRRVLRAAARLSGRTVNRLHVVGGGANHGLLNQLTADATGVPVLAGPVEATAIGNLLAQALARGELGDLAEMREVVHRSFPVTTYEPMDTRTWDEIAERTTP